MNSKGFTISELLVSLVILSILATLASASVISVMNNVADKNYVALIAQIETASESYAVDTGEKIFFIQDIIDNGYIESQNGKITDPKTKDKMNCQIVEVDYENGIYYATVDKTIYEKSNGTCDETKLANSDMNFYIKATPMPGSKYELAITCPKDHVLVISSNLGYYRSVNNTTQNLYTYQVDLNANIPVTYTATIKLVEENTIKSRSVTITP